ncbi:MAG TPA: methyltransferase [Candidatus Binatia bacterium]|nr:methyltransferase [Candidatus Binatia bacterium]
MRFVGLALGVVGLGLVVRSAALLAGRGRPQRGPAPAFVIAGPYVRMRNPLYAGVVVALGGVALAAGSWLLAAVTAVAAVGAHVWLLRVEEPRLLSRFGPAYAEYVRRVPRWIPRR